MNLVPRLAAAIVIVGLGTAALLVAMRDTGDPALPSMGIVLGGLAGKDAMLRDPPVPPELPSPPTTPGALTLAEPPRPAIDLKVNSKQPPVDDEQRREGPRGVVDGELPYLGYDEGHGHEQEDCAPGSAGPIEGPEDFELTEIPGPHEINPPPVEPGLVTGEPCEEPHED